MNELAKDTDCLAYIWELGLRQGHDRAFRLLLGSMENQGIVVFRLNLATVKDGCEDRAFVPVDSNLHLDEMEYWLYDRAVKHGHVRYVNALEATFGALHSEYFNARFFIAVEDAYYDLACGHVFEETLAEAREVFGLGSLTREVNAV